MNYATRSVNYPPRRVLLFIKNVITLQPTYSDFLTSNQWEIDSDFTKRNYLLKLIL